PTAEGVIPQPSVDRLLSVGYWLKRNREAIYGTTPGPLQGLEGLRSTARPGKAYLHIFDWPKGGGIEIPRFDDQVSGARLLSGTCAQLPLSVRGKEMVIRGPVEAPDPADTVIVLETGT
ncbi:MAG: alpha-L-fucosidase, partial [Anaerolineales bacterium]